MEEATSKWIDNFVSSPYQVKDVWMTSDTPNMKHGSPAGIRMEAGPTLKVIKIMDSGTMGPPHNSAT